jgi:hypothetical protein
MVQPLETLSRARSPRMPTENAVRAITAPVAYSMKGLSEI